MMALLTRVLLYVIDTRRLIRALEWFTNRMRDWAMRGIQALMLHLGNMYVFSIPTTILPSNTFEYCYRIAEREAADQVRYMFSRITDRDAVNMQPLSVDDGYVIGIGREA